MNKHLSKLVSGRWFEIEFWREQNAITGSSHGRNITWFVGHQDDDWVLRHYYRGGLMEQILGDKFVFTGERKTRCFQELELLAEMFEQGLPVPKPIAARISRHGLFYRADILIEKIIHAQDLVAKLSETKMSEAEWHAVGAMIAKFHEAGIYHSDLNAHNILIDRDKKTWLIDFDKCGFKKPQTDWQEANIARLLRSFSKEKKLNPNFFFDTNCWQHLMTGYKNFYHLKD